MKMDVLELREQKKIGARPSNKSAAQDYRAKMSTMNNEVRFIPLSLLLLNPPSDICTVCKNGCCSGRFL